jgi:hypothetical protein
MNQARSPFVLSLATTASPELRCFAVENAPFSLPCLHIYP